MNGSGADATSTNIDFSELQNSTIEIGDGTEFTLKFGTEVLDELADAGSVTMSLNLIIGNNEFDLTDSQLSVLLVNTNYVFGEESVNVIEEGVRSAATYAVKDASYEMVKGETTNTLVWTGTVVSSVPEPATASLCLPWLATLLMRRRRA